MYSSVHISPRETIARNVIQDNVSREADMRQELKEDYGVHKISPLRGASINDVYRDVKGSGGYVQDQMARRKAQQDAKRLEKQRNWRVGAEKRADKRGREAVERRQKEAAEKRAIRI
jgi:hypothetical protein